ncbi:MAG: polyprenyl synthetase family protein [Bacteroidales bacterium]
MENFEQLLLRVNNAVAALPLEQEPKALYEPIIYTLSLGGKRLRPVMALMACQLFKKSIEPALLPALGIEVFHNFTLLHDDIMDHADMRRGKATVHAKWNENVGILSGDAMFAVAYKLLAQGPEKVLKKILDSFNKMALGVCEGQQYDMNFETTKEVSMAEYMEMIRLKTSVLIAGALEIGGIIGEASPSALSHLYTYGIELGLAFQLQDDLLDLYGDEQKFGKKIGSDIRENKKTFLFLKALELLPEEEAVCLKKYFQTESEIALTQEEKIKAVRALYESIAMKKVCQQEIQNLYEKAVLELHAISKKEIDPQGLDILLNFSERLLLREY